MTFRSALAISVILPTFAVACGGGSSEQAKAPEQADAVAASDFDPCALLTSEEIQTTLGWATDSTQKKAYSTTGNCTYFGPGGMTEQISLLVGQGMPDMSDARKMADWRMKQYVDYGVKDAVVEPIEDLGVPAIRNEFGITAIEMAVGQQLVTISAVADFEKVKAIARLVLGRMK